MPGQGDRSPRAAHHSAHVQRTKGVVITVKLSVDALPKYKPQTDRQTERDRHHSTPHGQSSHAKGSVCRFESNTSNTCNLRRPRRRQVSDLFFVYHSKASTIVAGWITCWDQDLPLQTQGRLDSVRSQLVIVTFVLEVGAVRTHTHIYRS